MTKEIKTVLYYCDCCGKEITNIGENKYHKEFTQLHKGPLVLPCLVEYWFPTQTKYHYNTIEVKDICDECFLGLCDYVANNTPIIEKTIECAERPHNTGDIKKRKDVKPNDLSDDEMDQ